MRSKWFVLASCVVLAGLGALAVPAHAGNNCVSLNGTIVAQLGTDSWNGWAYFQFGKDPTVYAATVVDVNDGGYKPHTGRRNFAGYERLTFTFEDASSFQVTGQFIGVAGPTPNLYGFAEQGKIVPESGTGDFAGATGNLAIQGSFGGGMTEEQPWFWLAQITGSICAP